MNVRVACSAFGLAAVLVACHGFIPSNVPTSSNAALNQLPIAAPDNRKTAWGNLVDDPSGKPLAGVLVALYPWAPCKVSGKKLNCPKAVATTKTLGNGRFNLSAKNGHYILAIGSDDPNDTTRPTIHDNVTLTGGVQHIVAPSMPPLPLITPNAIERNGKYRLVTVNKTRELPCFTEFNAIRLQRGLQPMVLDEWLTENDRTVTAAIVKWWNNGDHGPPPTPVPSNPYEGLSTGNIGIVGGNSCHDIANDAFKLNAKYAANVQAHWFHGMWYAYDHSKEGTGEGQFPRDPRNFVDPNVPRWP
jgi:hypothetical protein